MLTRIDPKLKIKTQKGARVKKAGTTVAVAYAVGFYTTFVVQTLWNWFAVKAFNAPSVSYWEMYGVTMLLSLLLARDGEDAENKQRWNAAFMVLDACVPADKREELLAQLKAEKDEEWQKVGSLVFAKAPGNTFALVIGWAVYTFFIS
jgi:hypothetical protein